jgi:hypothetical protein
MIELQIILSKIIEFLYNSADTLGSTNFRFRGIFSRTVICDEIIWKFLELHASKRLHYARNASLSFTLLDN